MKKISVPSILSPNWRNCSLNLIRHCQLLQLVRGYSVPLVWSFPQSEQTSAIAVLKTSYCLSWMPSLFNSKTLELSSITDWVTSLLVVKNIWICHQSSGLPWSSLLCIASCSYSTGCAESRFTDIKLEQWIPEHLCYIIYPFVCEFSYCAWFCAYDNNFFS